MDMSDRVGKFRGCQSVENSDLKNNRNFQCELASTVALTVIRFVPVVIIFRANGDSQQADQKFGQADVAVWPTGGDALNVGA